jgi:hypothetical protein
MTRALVSKMLSAMSIPSPIRLVVVLAIALVVWMSSSVPVYGQTISGADAKPGTFVGTITDTNNDPVPNATVVLAGAEESNRRSVVTAENGYFEFHDVKPGTSYRLNVSAKNFADWNSPALTVESGQFKIVTGIQLRIETERSTVDVHYDKVEVAAEQFRATEQQRVFGVIPNFYVAYDWNAEPLTAKMKFKLALKISVDPITGAGVLFIAGVRQAANSPKYGQGWGPFGERFGSVAADGFTDIMIGGAILPTVLHQDPRYFYKGTGTNRARLRHAMLGPFVARGDNGSWQPNYSSIGGDLGSAALSNLYYPASNRGVGLVFTNFAVATAERIGADVAQEFLFGKFTKRGGHMQ